MNDIKILERYLNGKDTMKESLVRAIENLLKRNKELEQIEKEHKEENGRLREENEVLRHELEENTEEIDKLNVIIDLMAEQLATPVHSKKWVIEYFTNKVEEDIKEWKVMN